MKGVWFVLKIHIVQKGDTLWEISKKYGVDFEQVKQLNSHLASPDMIMPGMKIKIPSSSKAVKKESVAGKEMKKEAVKHPYKDMSPKAKPVIKEDDKEKQMPVKPEMPMQQLPQMPTQPIMQMPIMDQDFDFHNYTTINFPEMPQYKPEAKKEKPEKEMEKIKPMPLPEPQPMPEMPHHPQQMPIQMMVPMCCHIVHPCFPPVEFQVMGHMTGGFHPHMPPSHAVNPMEYHGSSPNMEYPVKPGFNESKDCGCGGQPATQGYPMPPYAFGPEQSNPAFNQQQMPGNNLYPPQFGQAPMSNYPFPSPPEYPNFSQREEKDDSKNE